MAHKQTGELKKRCQLAKQRLKMGYWEGRARTESAAAEPAATRDRVRAARDIIQVTKPDASLERMYKKVCEILDGDEITINPIGQLIESEVYDELDAAGKQRYILELSNKFGELKERYYRERTGA